jgi:NhaP-type Na+/H+ or K+/H+ antiporter
MRESCVVSSGARRQGRLPVDPLIGKARAPSDLLGSLAEMEFALFAVVGVIVIVVVTVLAQKLGVASAVILVVVGVGVSYIPGVPKIELPHEWILDGVLPPILYAAAISVPLNDFRRNLRTITSLSVVLVVVTAFAVGFLLHALLPDLNLAAAVALGAIISPPDAVAATSIGRRLGLPPRLLTLLEGEGLVNDATALVLLRSALAAAAGALSSPWAGVLDFLYAVAVAVVLGLAVGFVTVFVRSKLKDAVLDTALSFTVPFLAFLPAQFLGASGVLAVVVAGLYTGHSSAVSFSAQSRITDRINWRTVQFFLENAVFLVIGLEIRTLVENVQSGTPGVPATIGLGLLCTLALSVIRFFWAGPVFLGLRHQDWRAEEKLKRHKETVKQLSRERSPARGRAKRRRIAERAYRRQRADVSHLRAEGLDWRGGIILGWSGMRGVVTLAAAQSLPEDTPYRNQLILIAFTVAVTTLLLQGGTLPWLIRVVGIEGIDVTADRRALARLVDEISERGLAVLDNTEAVTGDATPVDPAVLDRVREVVRLRSDSAWERTETPARSGSKTPHRLFRELRLAVVAEERAALADARSLGTYPSRVLQEVQSLLDIEETRLRARNTGH